VTSESDIREGAVGGGVSPSSDLTSWRLNGTFVRSSAMPFNELTEGNGSFVPDFDHTILRCSGSGAREGNSFIRYVRGDFVQVPLACGCGGVIGTVSGCPMSISNVNVHDNESYQFSPNASELLLSF
jgi:hypothetical protein